MNISVAVIVGVAAADVTVIVEQWKNKSTAVKRLVCEWL